MVQAYVRRVWILIYKDGVVVSFFILRKRKDNGKDMGKKFCALQEASSVSGMVRTFET
jgi:hypothetical protein